MELRLLTTEAERRTFARRMEEARAKRGAQYRETRRSNIGKAHLEFGMLYALFEHDGEPAERMMSGFIMHDLATFPQSYPKPDLSHLPARSVLECGELWSFAKGAGLVARRGATIVAGLLQIRAFLVYPTVSPWDQSASYAQANFVRAGEPIDWPYCETVEGRKLWVQPMVLEGEDLAKLIHRVFSLGFETSDSHRRIRFENPFSLEPSLERPALPIEESNAIASGANGSIHEVADAAQT